MSPISDPRFSKARFGDFRKVELEESRRIERWEYRKALIVLALGAGTGLLLSGLHSTPANLPLMLIGACIQLGVGFFVAFVALLIAERLFIGNVGPRALAAIRLAAALAGGFATWQVAGAVPLYGIVATTLAYALLIVWLFEMELFEAVLLAIISWALVVAVVAGMAMLIPVL